MSVAIVMGSDSDWPTMSPAYDVLTELGIEVSAQVLSAHRMPRDMIDWAENAHESGVQVIIAGAGGAAHLPGMVASMTPLPVIGVPVPLKNLEGMDSLLSIVQMPAGIPVATVSISGAKNAGLLAARILAVGDQDLTAHLLEYRESLRQLARSKGMKLKDRLESEQQKGTRK